MTQPKEKGSVAPDEVAAAKAPGFTLENLGQVFDTIGATKLGRQVVYKVGQVLYRAGDPEVNDVFLLHRGDVQFFRRNDDKRFNYSVASAPWIFGQEDGASGFRQRRINAQALTECEVTRLPRGEALALMRSNPDFAQAMLLTLIDEQRLYMDHATDAIFLDARDRLAKLLLGKETQLRNGKEFIPGTQQALADDLGLSRETVNKDLSRFQRAKAIKTERKGGSGVTIISRENLRRRII